MSYLVVENGEAVAFDAIPILGIEEARLMLANSVTAGARISAFFALPREKDNFRIIAVVTDYEEGRLQVAGFDVFRSYPSFTPDIPQLHMFEREICEQYGIVPEKHPWLKPVRYQPPLRGALDEKRLPPACGDTDYFSVHGHEEHEVAVGPVHAGVIEPGHFRFQCHGEVVHHLEISLGYQHRGAERALFGGPHPRTMLQIETIAGDTTVGHGWVYCQNIEALAGISPTPEAQRVRAIALELERLANHTGDLGALGQDVGFLPTASYNGRIRGDFLNMTALICGSRLGRNLLRPGGVRFDLDSALAAELLKRLEAASRDVTGSAELLFEDQTVLSRFEHIGIVGRTEALELGFVGPAARASGVRRDVRFDFAVGPYEQSDEQAVVYENGDVYCRAAVRWGEVQQSIRLIQGFASGGELASARPAHIGALRPNSFVCSLIEGWRGEICHCALTDHEGRFRAYKIVDPSFNNWTALALALRSQQISDFPLNNKSFNLSYCGFDL